MHPQSRFLLLVGLELIVAVKLGVISQNGQSSTCAETYYQIDPTTCECIKLGCPVSSSGSDPQIDEFGTNAVSTADANGGNYVYIDEYWGYIQQITPNGTQVYPPSNMVPQRCLSGNPSQGELYRPTSLQFDYAKKTLYSLVNVPNNQAQTYDGKIVELDLETGECTDIVTNIAGSHIRWPYTCCGEGSGPAYDQSKGIYYAYGANGYPKNPSAYTLISVDIPNKNYAIGFLPASIYIAQGFMYFDSSDGLHALGYVNNKFGVYKLSSWEHNGDISAELVINNISTRGPSGWVYDDVTKLLHLVFDDYSFPRSSVVTVDMKKRQVTSCSLPKTCESQIWQWPTILSRS